MLGSDIVDEIVASAAPAALSSSSSSSYPVSDEKQQKQSKGAQKYGALTPEQQRQLFQFRKLVQINEQNNRAFDVRKTAIVRDLNRTAYCDLSPKGSVDEGCKPLMSILNAHPDFVSTSSCSGRISIFHMVTAPPLVATKKTVVLPQGAEATSFSSAGQPSGHHNHHDDDDNHDDHDDGADTQSLATTSAGGGKKRGVGDVATGWVYINHDPVPEQAFPAILDTVADFCSKFQVKTADPAWQQLGTRKQGDNNAKKAGDANEETAAAACAKNNNNSSSTALRHQLTFMVEAFCMHVSCRNTAAAQLLLAACVQAGFRNSGAVLGSSAGTASSSSSSSSSASFSSASSLCEPASKITVAIRHTAHLSAPLAEPSGGMLVSPAYVTALLHKGNEMMKENEARIKRLEHEVAKRLALSGPSSAGSAASAE